MKRICSAAVIVAFILSWVTPVGAAPMNLHSKLLTVSQLSTGWLKESNSSSEVFGCSASAFPSGSSAKAAVSFNYKAPKGFPLITEVLATFKNASPAYDTLTAGLAGCTHVSGTLHGTSFTGTIAKMSFQSYGNQSAAFDVHVNLGGTVIVVDVVVERKSNVCLELEEANFTSVSSSEFHSLAADAAAKL